ncbi:aspartic proteinase PCS1-like [Typha latifolia]|uniref:aspartic proteinase PCS1-like n=1 Tax=Typha latifolia TaxID=4733 RepID=UPI003C300414
MAFFSTSFFVLLLLCFAITCSAIRTTINARTTKPKPLLFPLRSQEVSSLSIPRPTNKLLFHHNVSLTVSLSVGTPPQNVSMVLDTGSELSWLHCNPGHSPGTSNSPQYFRPNSSASFSTIHCSSPACRSQTRDLAIPATCDPASHLCHVSLSYADASSSDGALSADLFRMGESPPVQTFFGCMDSTFDSSDGGAAPSGLLGMNRGHLSFISQTATRRFSYCISDRDSSGLLLLGHSDLPFLPLNYTPLVRLSTPLPYFDSIAYSIQLQGIRVSSTPLPLPKSTFVPDHTGAGQTMIDSGTQFTFLLGDAYKALKMEFLRQTREILTILNEPDFVFQGAFDLCFRIRESEPLPRLPPVVLQFEGAEVTVSGDRLLYKLSGERRGRDSVWCFTFGNSDMVPISAYVIGHHHQQNVWVEYDIENNRVGFAPIRCDVASQRLGLVL